jgi:hypothetical protein
MTTSIETTEYEVNVTLVKEDADYVSEKAPDMVKVKMLVGRPNYGVAFCVAPWPDGGWIAGVTLTDREWVKEQVEWGVLLPGLLQLSDDDHFPDWDIIDGFKNGLTVHGATMSEVVDLLFSSIAEKSTQR